MKVGRAVGRATRQLILLYKVIVRGEGVWPNVHESIAMELIPAGLGHQADHAGATARIGRGSVLGFHSILFDSVLRRLESGYNAGRIVLSDPDGAAIEHVIHSALEGAVDGVGRDIRPGAGVEDPRRIGGIGCTVGGADPGAQLYEFEHIAGDQGNAVNGFRGDELADGGVAGLYQ